MRNSGNGGMASVRFYSDPDEDLRTLGPVTFVWQGLRKRAAMTRHLEWAAGHPPPSLDEVRVRLGDGPRNDPERIENPIHPFCIFHSCADEFCTGLH